VAQRISPGCKSRVLLNEMGRRRPFLSKPEFSSATHPWAGYVFEETYSRNEPINGAAFARTTIFLCTGGGGTAHRKHRGVWEQHRIERGHVFIARKDVEIQSAWASNPWPTMLLQIDGAALRQLAASQVEAIESSLISAVTTRDERLAALMLAMSEEVKAGCPCGRLYGESLSLALLAFFAGTYARSERMNADIAGFTPEQMRRLVEYIDANLAMEIGVRDLAGVVQMSPSYFSRIFKASFGLTPYRFVMQKRIEAAKQMLAAEKHTSSEVALACNFASASHFARVFREFTGVTPKQYKAGL
jgi:AraC-like DNA-binding protein